ncbi:MAG TPA: hypothetical protein VKC63_07510 [Solirubrobacterales bacterium]|nr:hypothetical protein [Solirubrobacterales bacterium]
MIPKGNDPSSALSIKARVREVSAAEGRALRDRQIAAVGRLLRRAALISKHGNSSKRSSPATSRPRKRGK